ncbi:MAG: hypothetical protein RL701_7011 [Pseudomonadota bacterium]
MRGKALPWVEAGRSLFHACDRSAKIVDWVLHSLTSVQSDSTTPLTVSAIIEAAASSPYVKVVQMAAGIIQAAAQARWQQGVDHQLGVIRRELALIKDELAKVLTEVRYTRELILRRIDTKEKEVLVNAIQAKHGIFELILAKYSGTVGALVLTESDSRNIRQKAMEAVELTLQLEAWGDDSFVAYGNAYSLVTLAQALTGGSDVSVDGFRRQLLVFVTKSEEKYRGESEIALTSVGELIAQLPTADRWYWVSITTPRLPRVRTRSLRTH